MNACVVPASGGALEVAGLAVAERTRRVLRREGFSLVTEGSAANGAPTLFVAGDAALDAKALQALAGAARPGLAAMPSQNAIEAPAALWLPAGEATDVEIASPEALGAIASRLRAANRLVLAEVDGAVCQRIRTASDAERLERRLLAALVQPTDGFFARHFDRKISSLLSPHLVRFGVRPNTITLVATVAGIIGAALLATASHALQIAGALLFVASTILDGCDGEVARLSLTHSDFGRRLDLAGDNVVNAAVFLAIGWNAFHRPDGVAGWLVWVALTGFALATVTGFAFSRWIDRSGRKAELHDWYESLASRDFAYFVLLLAVIGRLHWFVGLTAFGTYAFAALLAAIRLRAARAPEGAGGRP